MLSWKVLYTVSVLVEKSKVRILKTLQQYGIDASSSSPVSLRKICNQWRSPDVVGRCWQRMLRGAVDLKEDGGWSGELPVIPAHLPQISYSF